jgi:folate-binding Fe-S cluster repair protein YgfZ
MSDSRLVLRSKTRHPLGRVTARGRYWQTLFPAPENGAYALRVSFMRQPPLSHSIRMAW